MIYYNLYNLIKLKRAIKALGYKKLYSGARIPNPGRTKYTAPLPAPSKYTVLIRFAQKYTEPLKCTPLHSKVLGSINLGKLGRPPSAAKTF